MTGELVIAYVLLAGLAGFLARLAVGMWRDGIDIRPFRRPKPAVFRARFEEAVRRHPYGVPLPQMLVTDWIPPTQSAPEGCRTDAFPWATRQARDTWISAAEQWHEAFPAALDRFNSGRLSEHGFEKFMRSGDRLSNLLHDNVTRRQL